MRTLADAALAEVAALAEQARAASVAQDARALLERVREGRFYVAFVGQFKRGKSTLINALLGEPLLPSGVRPITSVVTVVRFGERRARIRAGTSPWRDIRVEELPLYVSEDQNAENRMSLTAVEAFCPSPLLARGLCLVDTPGIGSVFRGNSAETRAFVPHIDAAIVVLGGDPPISGEELELIGSVAPHAPNLLFVLNKADRLTESERSEALDFTRTVLSTRVPVEDPTVLEVSALERLEARGPERDWDELVGRIEGLARAGGAELVSRAAARGLGELAQRLRVHLEEERSALLRPAEESARRLEALRSCAREAGQATRELKHLFDAEEERLDRAFDAERRRFVAEATPEIAAWLQDRLAAAPPNRARRLGRYALEQAQGIAETLVGAWMRRQDPHVKREFTVIRERFVTHANALLERLQSAGQHFPGRLPSALADMGLYAPSRYYFLSELPASMSSWRAWLAGWFRGAHAARAHESGVRYARELLELNANRVASDFAERVRESRRSVEASLQRVLQETTTSAEQAALRAREAQARGASAVAEAVASVDDQLRRLDECLARQGAEPPPATTSTHVVPDATGSSPTLQDLRG